MEERCWVGFGFGFGFGRKELQNIVNLVFLHLEAKFEFEAEVVKAWACAWENGFGMCELEFGSGVEVLHGTKNLIGC